MLRTPYPYLCLIFLTACASSSMEFRGASRHDLTLGGDLITVFHQNDRAQAVRTNYCNKAQRKGAVERLVLAIELTTGCKVRLPTLKGDQVLVTASLTCS